MLQENDTNGTDVNDSGQQQEEHNQPQGAATSGEQADRDARSESVTTPTEGQAEDPQQEQEQGNWVIRAFIFVCMTIQAFFTSLLPTPPELLEAN